MALFIVSDSACDLPDDVISQFRVEILPIGVEVDGQQYQDNVTLKSTDLMERMRKGAATKTTQVTAYQFAQAFEKYAKNGDSVIYIAFSSGLSGSYNSANMAKVELLEQYPNFDLTIIDSKCASLGFGMVVYYALKLQQEGASKAEIVSKTIENAERMEHIFTVDDLEYLFRGGRVSRTAALVGGLLGIKPVLDVDEDGHLHPLEKVRGRKNAIKRMAALAEERGNSLSKQLIGISHGDDMAAVEELKELMRTKFGCTQFMVNNIGCAVGAHSGPGTLALFFLSK